MPFAMQTRLLRVLEERMVSPLGGGEPVPLDIRILSATHRDLSERITERLFREDLFYRLSGLEIGVPPLREREDKVDLMQRLLSQACEQGQITVTDAAQDRLCAYAWPGNVRQMRSVIRTLVALSESGVVTLDDLPDELREMEEGAAAEPSNEAPLEAAERQALRATLDACQGQVSAAARKLGVSRNTLYRKLKRFGLLRG
jgi:transcriptional regulator of acetoin/glycerol metabolism